MKTVAAVLAAAWLSLLALSTTHAGFYRCVNAAGQSQIQDTPCAQDTEEAFVTPALPAQQAPQTLAQPQPMPRSQPRTAVERLEAKKSWDPFCKSTGENAFSVAIQRDNGIPASDILVRQGAILQQLHEQDRVLFEPYYRLLVLQVYANRWWSPAQAQQEMEASCLVGFNK
jgi:hypothetical protein